ncbi:endonuclease YncB(thermonuclease family) [Nitrosospira multiformis]|uniref:Endonuclease YncB(Thermonuclease family) n=1 Tax=Nitrosospira multiformis TaxID=1231 RepID=A0A2T5IDY1_9PROT|nr:thermonuclease family protein [Nitrosospira multiformis]PTQ82037.1 endonuclease YncB(thermonuclease family) [Nitrosospira multiformis]
MKKKLVPILAAILLSTERMYLRPEQLPFKVMMVSAIIALSSLVALPLSAAASADEIIRAKAVSIVDGDSISAVINQELVRVRLAEVDAPEGNQPFAIDSRQSLHDLCFWVEAELSSISKDYYGRMLAKVKCNAVNVNAEQVRRGMAWVADQSVKDGELVQLQEEARAAKRGLGSYESPVPPWEWHSRGWHSQRSWSGPSMKK